MERPEYVTDEHLKFLDNLRESGVTNMLGAGVYISGTFSTDTELSNKILSYWMKTFGEEDR